MRHLFSVVVISFLLAGCQNSHKKFQFRLLKKDSTGLEFMNVVKQSSDFNVLNYIYFYSGGGIAAGDFNNDGLIDLFFTSNMGPNKLFINEGHLKFKDVSISAKIEGTKGWTTGASVVDINNDGLLDIYVSQVGDFGKVKSKNQFFVCVEIKNRIPVYEDKAFEYGLDLVGFGTQASFFDYDNDGDLDMFQLNHSVHDNGTFLERSVFENTIHETAGDKLMRNDNGKFVEVTSEAGILSTAVGYGLGIATSDINLDGWPDIYIGNDFHENDYLYINQKNGTFKEELTSRIKHTSKFSMGVDMADINNDAFSDIVSLDMLPYDPVILKNSMGDDTYSVFQYKLSYGYNQQYARNNLQLNKGDGTFSEIGMYAGIHATDWSWSSLFFDFDYDGYKDLFISNGIPRRMNDLDYVNHLKSHEELIWKAALKSINKNELEVIDSMPKIKLRNKVFRNTHDLHFLDIESEIDGDLPTYSNGTIYADLDGDGDQDVVVNNNEDEPYVYQNLTIENKKKNADYLSVKLIGSPGNRNAIGTKAVVFRGSEKIFYEQFPVRGFQSSMQDQLYIGLGDKSKIDSVVIIWPDNTYQNVEAKNYSSSIVLTWKHGLPVFNYEQLKLTQHLDHSFKDITSTTGIDYVHHENTEFVEFNREPLIPYMVSREGPAMAVGDLNGDGLDDIYFGSSKWKKSCIYVQNKVGHFSFETDPIILNDSTYEDVAAVIFDIENDGDNDIVVASGGNEFWGKSEYLKQRAYINNGHGNFQMKFISNSAFFTASCVLPADFNNDGLVDLYFGARAVPNEYGTMPSSHLFKNMGNGKFEDVTTLDLQLAGMVNNGAWVDIDHDGDVDLVLACDWQPIKIFLNEKTKFKLVKVGDEKGWWNFVLPHDFDGDGDIDLLAGNLGENSRFKPSKDEPVKMYVNDFDDNGQVEQIVTYHLGGREIPFASFPEITKQIPLLKKKYLYAKQFSKASLSDLFTVDKLNKAEVSSFNYVSSSYFENKGNGTEYILHPLPASLQFSMLKAAAMFRNSVLLGGNFFNTAIEVGRFDANDGNVLTFRSGKMNVSSLGFNIDGEVKSIVPIIIAGDTCFVFSRNNQAPIVVKPSASR